MCVCWGGCLLLLVATIRTFSCFCGDTSCAPYSFACCADCCGRVCVDALLVLPVLVPVLACSVAGRKRRRRSAKLASDLFAAQARKLFGTTCTFDCLVCLLPPF